jgi:hypothetical protein
MRNRTPTRLDLDSIGRSAFGDGLRETKKEGGVVTFTSVPKMDGNKDQNYNRMFAAALTAAPLTFQHETSVKTIRFIALDGTDANKKLLVYSLSKDSTRGVDWMHGANPGTIRGIATIEHEAPEIRP